MISENSPLTTALSNVRLNEGRIEDTIEFYQSHLDRVSRSFAFCIARLEGAMRERVGLSYLLCRVLDTVEDANWPSFAAQERAFRQFDSFMQPGVFAQGICKDAQAGSSVAEVASWVGSFPDGINEGEAALLRDAHFLFQDFHRLPLETRLLLGRLVCSMSGGMRHYMAKKASVGRLVLSTVVDVNKYCFFVAGVVGEILTGFVTAEKEAASVARGRLKDSFSFGLFLQKVNLLKDQKGDEKEGRFLVPSRDAVFSSLIRDAEGAFRYLVSLPVRDQGFRLFCAWSLFLGLASLPWIQKAALSGAAEKIPRDETLALLCRVEQKIGDDQALAELYRDLTSIAWSGRVGEWGEAEPTEEVARQAVEESVVEGLNQEDQALLALYSGDLPKSEVLGLFRGDPIFSI